MDRGKGTRHKKHKHHKQRHHSSATGSGYRSNDEKEDNKFEQGVAMSVSRHTHINKTEDVSIMPACLPLDSQLARTPGTSGSRDTDNNIPENLSIKATLTQIDSVERQRNRSRDRHRATLGDRHKSRSYDRSELSDVSRRTPQDSPRSRSSIHLGNRSHNRSRSNPQDRSRSRSSSHDGSKNRFHDPDRESIKDRKRREWTGEISDSYQLCTKQTLLQNKEKDSDSESSEHTDDDKNPDYKFDWESQRYTLDRIFFRREDYIKRFVNICSLALSI